MRKIGLVLAAAGALVLFLAPAMEANAANKKLWEGWVEEMQKAREGVMTRMMPAKK